MHNERACGNMFKKNAIFNGFFLFEIKRVIKNNLKGSSTK